MSKEIIGQCETCLKPIYEGDIFCFGGDFSFCEEHAFTLQDCIDQHVEAIKDGENYFPDHYENMDELKAGLIDLEANIKANGNRKILTT